MQTALADFIRDTPEGREADAILRRCVHCGFCTATCPTYQLLGDELDGPRGRIYLIKQVLEGATPTAKTRLHLDRCLTCRSCETTCPSGVEYGRLLDIGRHVVDARAPRPAAEQATRWALRQTLLAKPLFGAAVALGRAFRPLLPQALAAKVPGGAPAGVWPPARHPRRMLVLEGCVQPALAPGIDAAMARVLDRVGISLLKVGGGGCCGALPHHLDATDDGRALARRNIDAWWPQVERGAEAIVVTASGCGVMVKDYGHFLRADPAYAAKAARVAALAKDTVEVVAALWPQIAPRVAMDRGAQRVAFHPPCTLQHGMQLKGRVEEILAAMGLEVVPVRDAHLCCGSAGTYSVLQPELAAELRRRKVEALSAERPEVIATANIGCLTHLAEAAAQPVRHWIELLDERMVGGVRPPVAR
ncbi:MAG: glycolate oxidase subunit GlcF [Betaproteobacteria bacterium]|nr:glycolate oxidase subunit GlcF [Betaproteobacteria bacterium]